MNKLGLFVFVALVAATLAVEPMSEELKQKIKEIHTKCQSDPATTVEEESIRKLYAGENVQDPKLGPHMLCMSKGMKYQKENGDLDMPLIEGRWRKHYKDDYPKVAPCLVQKATPEETAIELFKCNQKAIPQQNIHEHHHGEHKH